MVAQSPPWWVTQSYGSTSRVSAWKVARLLPTSFSGLSMPGCATITQPSTPVPATIFTGAPLSISVKKLVYGIDDRSTWPEPKIAAMSPLVGAFTNSRLIPY